MTSREKTTCDEVTTESDSTSVSDNESRLTVQRIKNDLNMKLDLKSSHKVEALLTGRLMNERHRDQMHARATRLKRHYKEMEACDKIMAYGFITILFLCFGFLWFMKLFGSEIRETFAPYRVIAPAFIYGSIILGALDYFL